MSDPVTNVEIEDVLSSIRRLVSEDARPRRTPEVNPAERLVLSPALRVADERDEALAPEQAVFDGTAPEPTQSDGADAPIILTTPAEDVPDGPVPDPAKADNDQAEVIPEASFVLAPENRAETETDEPQSAEVFGAEPTLAEEQDAVLLSQPSTCHDTMADPAQAEADQLAALRASLTDILIPDPEMDGPDTDDPQPDDVQSWSEDGEPTLSDKETELTDEDGSLQHKIATLQNLLQQHAQGGNAAPAEEPQPSGMGTFEAFEAERDAPDSPAAPTPVEEAGEPAVGEGLADHDGDARDVSDDTLTEQKDADLLAEVEAAAFAPAIDEPLLAPTPESVANSDDAATLGDPVVTQSEAGDTQSHQPDPATVEQIDEAAAGAAFLRHTTLDWEDHVPGSGAEADATAAPPVESEADKVPAELDEEALQALVANIVRQELQGVLGERITRNVRKLVRREIHRVLMSKDLD